MDITFRLWNCVIYPPFFFFFCFVCRWCEWSQSHNAINGQIGHGRDVVQFRHRSPQWHDTRSVSVAIVVLFHRWSGSDHTVSKREYLRVQHIGELMEPWRAERGRPSRNTANIVDETVTFLPRTIRTSVEEFWTSVFQCANRTALSILRSFYKKKYTWIGWPWPNFRPCRYCTFFEGQSRLIRNIKQRENCNDRFV